MSDWFSDERATFGDRLTAAREAAGLERAAMARRLGVSERTVRAWEEDRAEPRSNRMQIVAGLLNVSLMWLMSGKSPGPSPALAAEAEAPPPEELGAVLTDLGAVRADMARMAGRIEHLERRLRRAARAGSG